MIFVNSGDAKPMMRSDGTPGCRQYQIEIRNRYLAPELVGKLVVAEHAVYRTMQTSGRLAMFVFFNDHTRHLIRQLTGNAKPRERHRIERHGIWNVWLPSHDDHGVLAGRAIQCLPRRQLAFRQISCRSAE